jgi:hypothetical protein
VASAVFPGLQFEVSETSGLKETGLLTLDSHLANKHLGWKNKIKFEEAVTLSLPNQDINPRAVAYSSVRNFLER